MIMLYRNYLFYFLAVMLFIADIFIYSFFEKQMIYLTLCFYFLTLCSAKEKFFKLLFLGILLSIQSSLYHGIFGIQLLYLIPLSLCAISTEKLLYSPRMHAYFFLFAALLIQSFYIEIFLLSIPLAPYYTNLKIIANMIMMLIMSLILFTQGKQGNRWKAHCSFLEESPDS
jgi:hypothetical protein